MKKILISLTVFNKDIRNLPIFELVNSGSINESIEILITDNSYKPSTIPNLIPNTHYKFSGYNAGTRQAILNTVSFLRERDQFNYVLFLDQDTQVDFLTDFLLEASQCYDTPMVFVPEVHDQNGDIVSPCAVNYFGGMRGCKDNYDTAILSGALIPTAFLCEIKHIPRIFWLDYLDHFLFFNYFPKPKLLSTIVEHNL